MMPNGVPKTVSVEKPTTIVPYACNGLIGQSVQMLKDFDVSALPWDDPKVLAPAQLSILGNVDRIKKSHTRCVLSFEVTGPTGIPIRIFAKRCRARSLKKKLASLFAPNKSRREWEVGWEVLRRGLPTAMPLLWAERRVGGMMAENYLLTLGVERGISFLDVWRTIDSVEMRHQWLERLAVFLRRLHDKGFAHDDLNAKHVLITSGYPAQLFEPEFTVIDLDNARICDAIGAYRRAHNFFQIFRSLPSRLFGEKERQVFLNAYSGGKWSAEDLKAVNRAVNTIAFFKKVSKFWRRK